MDWKNSQKFKDYQGKSLLSIDYGTKRVGLATFCPGRDPYPLIHSTIQNKDKNDLLQRIGEVISDESIDAIILGCPHLLDGKETDMTRMVKNFGQELEKHVSPIPLTLQDETLSSFEAEDRMKNSPQFNFKIDKEKLDQVSAVIILEDFLRDD